MPKLTFPAAGEAMAAAFLGRFSGCVIQMAEASQTIERNAASIASAMALIHGGGTWRIQIDHQAEFVLIVRR